jgi:hypothetical protein
MCVTAERLEASQQWKGCFTIRCSIVQPTQFEIGGVSMSWQWLTSGPIRRSQEFDMTSPSEALR